MSDEQKILYNSDEVGEVECFCISNDDGELTLTMCSASLERMKLLVEDDQLPFVVEDISDEQDGTHLIYELKNVRVRIHALDKAKHTSE